MRFTHKKFDLKKKKGKGKTTLVDTASPLHEVLPDHFSDILHWKAQQKLHDAWQRKLVSLPISARFRNGHGLIRDLNSQDNKIAVCNLFLEKRSSKP